MRILFVAMPQNMHSVRHINMLSAQDWDVHVFPSYDTEVLPYFRNITAYHFSSARPKGLDSSIRVKGLWPLRAGSMVVRSPFKRYLPCLSNRALWLAWLIRWLKPDIIHSQTIFTGGYLTMEAKTIFQRYFPHSKFPPWIASNWGIDIHFLGRLPTHRERIKEVLSNCDYYICECHRDVRLARELGLKGEVLPVLPIGGGYDIKSAAQLRQPGPTSARRLIVLKGYQNLVGRALVGLRAIERCVDILKGYSVAIYLSDNEVIPNVAALVSQSTGIPIRIIQYSPHEDVLRLHGQARISIALSASDAISTSLLEAMLMGSFPIQSNTACAEEWVQDGETALLVHPEDTDAVEAAIRRAIEDDALVDRAAEVNNKVLSERLDQSLIQAQIIEMYNSINIKGRDRA